MEKENITSILQQSKIKRKRKKLIKAQRTKDAKKYCQKNSRISPLKLNKRRKQTKIIKYPIIIRE